MDLFGTDAFLSDSNSLLLKKTARLSQQSFYHRDNHCDNQCLLRQQQQYHQRYSDKHQSKSQPSYIGLIAMAILSSNEQKMVLSEVYQWIIDNYPNFRTRGIGWRNSIRHNLSLNDCFIKAGRSINGKVK